MIASHFYHKNTLRVLAVVAACAALIVFNPNGLLQPVRKVVLDAGYPLEKTFYFLGDKIYGILEFLGSISDLKEENERLLKENNALFGEVASLRDQEKENASLREQLGLVPREKFHLEASFVIGQNPQQLGSWILIDKGSSSGIEPGMAVIAYQGILMGKVEEVSYRSAKVKLLSDSESAVNVMDLETGTKGIVKGEYSLGIMMDMIAQSDAVNAGDMIVTSGLGSEIPRGLLVGRVREIKNSRDELFQQALINPEVKYSKLETVFVITK